MIPTYLKGKSAIAICTEMASRRNARDEWYIRFLEAMVLIATTHALCAADTPSEPEADGRAMAFLNLLLPKED